jgi:PEP-CTERM motif
MKSKMLCLLSAAVLVLALGSMAKADSIGTLTLSDCGSGQSGCPAATYYFDIGTTSAMLTITITGAVNSNNDYIEGVDLGFSPSGNINSGPTLVSSPNGDTSLWKTDTDSLSNGGCGTNSGAFICSSALSTYNSGNGLLIAQNGVYTWTWNYTLSNNTLIDGVGDVHVGANYNPHNGWIVSETGATPSVPEPGSLALFGTGLLGLAGFMRRKLFS